MRAFLIVGILAASVYEIKGNYWEYHWMGKWGILLGFLSIFISFWFGKRLHWSVGLLSASVLISSVYAFSFPASVVGLDVLGTLAVRQYAAIAGISVLLLFSFVALLPKKEIEMGVRLLGVIAFINALVIIYQRMKYPGLPFHWGGIIGNPSMSASFTAAMIPFCPFVGLIAYPLFSVAAVFICGSTTGGLVLIATMITWVWSATKNRLYTLISMLVVLCGVVSFSHKKDLFQDSGRLWIWDLMLKWWVKSGRFILGSGPGTMSFYTPLEEVKTNYSNPEMFLWLHSDWIQVLIEQGVVGILASILVYTFAIKRSLGRPELTASIIGFGVMGITNYPIHIAPTALTTAMLLGLAFKKERGE